MGIGSPLRNRRSDFISGGQDDLSDSGGTEFVRVLQAGGWSANSPTPGTSSDPARRATALSVN